MIAFLQKFLLFLFVLLLLSIAVRNTIPYALENEEFNKKLQTYKALKKTKDINTLFFGSSRIYHHISPEVYDRLMADYKSASYNFSLPGTFNPESYFLLEKFLEKDVKDSELDLIIIELQSFNNLYSRNIFSHKASYWNNFPYYYYALNFIINSNLPLPEKTKLLIKYSISFIYRLSSYPKLFQKQKTTKLGDSRTTTGFVSIDDQIKKRHPNDFHNKIREKRLSDSLEIERRYRASGKVNALLKNTRCNEVLQKKLQTLIEKAEKKNCHLLFLIPPRLTLKDYQQTLPFINCLPEKNILQMADRESYPYFYQAKYIIDRGHLNGAGAIIFTEKLTELIISSKISTVYN
ncbi:hypothetical protein HZR84_00850 [Hyphobacterium sp. CCMP332]|nr:hypothetical protein HZR84_00850 [Hyphobacterium sp. CCMP332]